MKRLAHAGVAGLVVTLLVVAPTTAARPSDCTLDLDVAPVHEYGETVVMHVSGLPGTGGVDIFTSWRNRVEEDHLFLIAGITEFDYIYRAWGPPEEPPLPPLEPGKHRVYAVDATGCEATTTFRVTR
jgi:hypothetical protein